jgi:hypothetical protein
MVPCLCSLRSILAGKWGGDTLACGLGGPNSDDWRKSLVLCPLCVSFKSDQHLWWNCRRSGGWKGARLELGWCCQVRTNNLHITVKAPNFDRVFMKNIFLLHIFVMWPPLKKINERVKVFVVPKLKFLFWGSLSSKERFSKGVEVTIWVANFDRYKKILADLGLQRKVYGKFNTNIIQNT